MPHRIFLRPLGLLAGRVRPRTRRLALSAVAGIALTAAASACTNTSATSASSGSAGSAGTLTIAMPPGITGASSLALPTNCMSPLFSLTYASLINVQSDGTYGPGLATSWNYSNKNTVFTLHLRSGVKFADGTPLTAANVVATLKYYQKVPGLNQGYLTPFTSITAPDPTTVVIKYQHPFNGMTTLLANDGECMNGSIISAAGLADPAKMGTNMFGAGPYELDAAATVAGDHYTLVRNPHYYDPSAQHWNKVIIRVITDANTALQAVESGQIQVSTVNDGTLVPSAKAAGVTVSNGLDLGAGLMILDRNGTLVPALKSQLVRQAIQYAVNRPALAKVLGPQYHPFDQFVPQGVTGYDPSLDNVYPYDPQKAKQLLAQAGYPNGFSLTIGADGGDPAAANMLQGVAQELTAVGIHTTINTAPAGTIFTQLGEKKVAVVGSSYALLGDTYFDAVRLTAEPYAAVWDPFRASDPAVTAEYDKLAVASQSELPSLSQDFNRLITQKAWFIPIAAAASTVYSKGIEIGTSAPIGQFNYIGWKSAS